MLEEEDETVLIPPLPEKNRDANASNPREQTILERKAGLERFLNKIVTHGQLRKSPNLRKFICRVREYLRINLKPEYGDKSSLKISTFQKISSFFVSGRMLTFKNKNKLILKEKSNLEKELLQMSENLKKIVKTHYKLRRNLESEFVDLSGSQQFSYMFKQIKTFEMTEHAGHYVNFTSFKLALMESSELLDDISEKRKDLLSFLNESLRDLKLMIEIIERLPFSRDPSRMPPLDKLGILSPELLLIMSNDERLYIFKLLQAKKQLNLLFQEKNKFIQNILIIVADSYYSLYKELKNIWKKSYNKQKLVRRVTAGVDLRTRTKSVLQNFVLNRRKTLEKDEGQLDVKLEILKVEQVTDQDRTKFEIYSNEVSSNESEKVGQTQVSANSLVLFRNSFGIRKNCLNMINLDFPEIKFSKVSNLKFQKTEKKKFKSFSNLSSNTVEIQTSNGRKPPVSSPRISEITNRNSDIDFIPQSNPFLITQDIGLIEDLGGTNDLNNLQNSIFKNPHAEEKNIITKTSNQDQEIFLNKFDSFSSKSASNLAQMIPDKSNSNPFITQDSFGEVKKRQQSPSFSKTSDSVISTSNLNPEHPNPFKRKKKVENLSSSTLQDSDISGVKHSGHQKDPYALSNSEEEEFFTKYRNQFDSLFKFNNQETPRPSEVTKNIFYDEGLRPNGNRETQFLSEHIPPESDMQNQSLMPDQSFFEEFGQARDGNYFTYAQKSMKRKFGIKEQHEKNERMSNIIRSKSNEKDFNENFEYFCNKMKKKRNSDVLIN